MEHENNLFVYEKARLELFCFCPSRGGVSEYHVVVHATCPEESFHTQLEAVLSAFQRLRREQMPGAATVFQRFFLSDAANQAPFVWTQALEDTDGALSVVQQPPLDGTKVALYAYLLTEVTSRVLPCGLYEVAHGSYRHLWAGSMTCRAVRTEYQTRLLLNDYVMRLASQGCRLADHCLRTWFFVQNVDVNYAGVVKARNEVFATQDLTPDTHFIASTGIGGRHADPEITVQMDAYAVAGIRPEQVRQLYAPAYLNRTYEYGVSFERGTSVDYGDRRQVFISGTASIDHLGQVVHPGDIRLQTERMWQNVEALLQEAGCGFGDVAHMLVYLRDVADYAVVREMFQSRFPQVPHVLLLAPVCRPGWLIEMECMAVRPLSSSPFPAF